MDGDLAAVGGVAVAFLHLGKRGVRHDGRQTEPRKARDTEFQCLASCDVHYALRFGNLLPLRSSRPAACRPVATSRPRLARDPIQPKAADPVQNDVSRDAGPALRQSIRASVLGAFSNQDRLKRRESSPSEIAAIRTSIAGQPR